PLGCRPVPAPRPALVLGWPGGRGVGLLLPSRLAVCLQGQRGPAELPLQPRRGSLAGCYHFQALGGAGPDLPPADRAVRPGELLQQHALDGVRGGARVPEEGAQVRLEGGDVDLRAVELPRGPEQEGGPREALEVLGLLGGSEGSGGRIRPPPGEAGYSSSIEA